MPSLELLFQALLSGIMLGGVYALVAMSLALVFGVMRVLNFAHGDILMVAMYGVVVLNKSFGWHPYVAGLAMLPVMALLGLLLFRVLIRPVLGASPLMQTQLTIGLSFVIQSAALMIFGADLLNVSSGISEQTFRLGGAVIGMPQALAFVISIVVCGLLSWSLARTETGQRIRATAQDPVMARLCAVPVPRLQMLVFAGCIALLAIPAACLMTFFYVTPSVGIRFSLLSLLVVVLGGLGDLRGAFVGAIIIGVIESLAAAVLNSAAAPAATYIVFGLALVLRPRGLFGRGSGA